MLNKMICNTIKLRSIQVKQIPAEFRILIKHVRIR